MGFFFVKGDCIFGYIVSFLKVKIYFMIKYCKVLMIYFCKEKFYVFLYVSNKIV